jgi:hypothetical protein
MCQVFSLRRMVVQHILQYFIKKIPFHVTLWISSSIHHITLEMKYKGSSSGGPHRDPTSDPKTIDAQIGYGTKYGETTTTSI